VQETRIETPIQRLARSLFGFALVAFIIGLVVWIALLLSPISPDSTFAQLRLLIIIGFGVIVALIFGFMVWALRTPMENLERIANVYHRIFRRTIVSIIVLFMVLEINIILGSLLQNVAPAIFEPLRFALAGWSLVGLAMVITLNWNNLRKWLNNTNDIWASLGFSIVLLLVIAILFFGTAALVQRTGLNNQLRGGLDYRNLAFIEDENVPTSQDFWLEQAQTRVRWSPYSYWVVDQISGDFVNVNPQGLRQTSNFVEPNEEILTLAVFGGSTVWGEGSRDGYTIPSQISRLLNDAGTPYYVTNYGQTGYVSTQDLIMFQMQLLNGNIPDVAIFYGGFNDILSAYQQNVSGITLQESSRISDSEMGRTVRAGQPVVRPLNLPVTEYDLSLIAPLDGSAESIVTRYLANVQMIQTLADAYGVQVIFVWQPMIVFKENRIGEEEGAFNRMNTERVGLAELYSEVDSLLRTRLGEPSTPQVLMLGNLFNGDEREIFYDLIHITEEGNLSVAQAIINRIQDN
jgi:lysophospholipase L1-like esterase